MEGMSEMLGSDHAWEWKSETLKSREANVLKNDRELF